VSARARLPRVTVCEGPKTNKGSAAPLYGRGMDGAGAFGSKDLASGLLDEGPQVADGTQAQTPCAEASARRRKSSKS